MADLVELTGLSKNAIERHIRNLNYFEDYKVEKIGQNRGRRYRFWKIR